MESTGFEKKVRLIDERFVKKSFLVCVGCRLKQSRGHGRSPQRSDAEEAMDVARRRARRGQMERYKRARDERRGSVQEVRSRERSSGSGSVIRHLEETGRSKTGLGANSLLDAHRMGEAHAEILRHGLGRLHTMGLLREKGHDDGGFSRSRRKGSLFSRHGGPPPEWVSEKSLFSHGGVSQRHLRVGGGSSGLAPSPEHSDAATMAWWQSLGPSERLAAWKAIQIVSENQVHGGNVSPGRPGVVWEQDDSDHSSGGAGRARSLPAGERRETGDRGSEDERETVAKSVPAERTGGEDVLRGGQKIDDVLRGGQKVDDGEESSSPTKAKKKQPPVPVDTKSSPEERSPSYPSRSVAALVTPRSRGGQHNTQYTARAAKGNAGRALSTHAGMATGFTPPSSSSARRPLPSIQSQPNDPSEESPPSENGDKHFSFHHPSNSPSPQNLETPHIHDDTTPRRSSMRGGRASLGDDAPSQRVAFRPPSAAVGIEHHPSSSTTSNLPPAQPARASSHASLVAVGRRAIVPSPPLLDDQLLHNDSAPNASSSIGLRLRSNAQIAPQEQTHFRERLSGISSSAPRASWMADEDGSSSAKRPYRLPNGKPLNPNNANANVDDDDANNRKNKEKPQPWCFYLHGEPLYSTYIFLSDPGSSQLARMWALVIAALILASSVSFVLETLPQFRIRTEVHGEVIPAFFWIEVIAVGVFTIEYILRLVTVNSVPDEDFPRNRRMYHEAQYRLEATRKERKDIVDALHKDGQPLTTAPSAITTTNNNTYNLPTSDDGEEDPGPASFPHPDGGISPQSQANNNSSPLRPAPIVVVDSGKDTRRRGSDMSSEVSAVREHRLRKQLEEVDDEIAALERIRDPTSFFERSRRRLMVLVSFIISPLNIIDLLAIAPFYVEILAQLSSGNSPSSGSSLTIFRVLRLARVFRIFKLSKYSKSMQLLGKVFIASADALLVLLWFVIIGLVLFGALLFLTEGGQWDPETQRFMRPSFDGRSREPTPIDSIPAAFWLVIATASTTGYGDVSILFIFLGRER